MRLPTIVLVTWWMAWGLVLPDFAPVKMRENSSDVRSANLLSARVKVCLPSAYSFMCCSTLALLSAYT